VKNEATKPFKTGNDLVTELLLFFAFICTFASCKGSKAMY